MLPPAGLELPEEVLPDSLVFRDASTRDVFSALGLFADVSVIFDPAFVDERLSVDLRGATLTTALTSVARSTRNFYRVTAPQTVTVIPDTPAKRREYEQEIVQTFYLSKPNCRCQATPPQLHGPYYQWTRKVRGKTVTVRLTEQQAERVRHWIENGRQLDRIVVEMETLSLRMTERLLRQTKPE